VVFGSYDAFVYCLSTDDGKLLWKFETGGRVHGSPAITDAQVLVAGCDEHLHVLKLSDGQEVTRVSMGSVSGASAAIVDSKAFVGTYGHQFLGIDWKMGHVLWTHEDAERQFPILSSAAVTAQTVLVGGRDKRLRALDPKSGQLQWVFATDGRIDASPVAVGSRVFIASADGNLYGIDVTTGKEVWRFETGAPISASPAVGDGCLVIGNEDGTIFCFAAG
jgi:glucose dehydrogenase